MNEVTCTNCGDSGPALWLSIAALVIAVGSLLIASRQLWMARKEHAEFIKALNRRASLDGGLTVQAVTPLPDGWSQILVAVGFRNTGDKAANDVLINARVADYCRLLVRADAAGAAVTAPTPASSSGPLIDAQGRSWGLIYLSWTEPRVSRTHNFVRWIRFEVPPGTPGVPVEVSFNSDDFRDEAPEVTIRGFFDVP